MSRCTRPSSPHHRSLVVDDGWTAPVVSSTQHQGIELYFSSWLRIAVGSSTCAACSRGQLHIESCEALVGFQGRGCADGVQPDFCHPLFLEALLFQSGDSSELAPRLPCKGKSVRNRGVSQTMPFLVIPRSLLRGGFIKTRILPLSLQSLARARLNLD
jgi:hypothetical protein